MMNNSTRLRILGRNVYLSCRKFQSAAKLFYSYKKETEVYTCISHSVFFDYLESSKVNNPRGVVKMYENNHNVKSKYSRELWKKDLDKETISSILNEVDPVHLRNSFKDIEIKCAGMINQLTAEEILKYLIIFLRIKPAKTSRTKFFAQSIDILKTALKRNQLNNQDILTFLFFASIRRESRISDVKFIIKYMQPIDELSLIGKSIYADIVFKCSIKLSRLQARVIEETIEENAISLAKNTFLLVSLCKAVRFTGPSKRFTMNKLSQALVNEQTKYELPAIVHILSLYCEAYYKNTDVLTKLHKDAFSILRTEYMEVRLKDIDRLLWLGRILNHPLEKSEIAMIVSILDRQFPNVISHIDLLVNIYLSLWMHGHRSERRIRECFENKMFKSILENETSWKGIARLNLLLTCIKIEAPEIQIPEELNNSHEVGWKINKNVNSMSEKLNVLKDDLRLNCLELNCPIKGLYIPGISAKHNELTNVHIDLLDTSTCLRDSDEPHGLMNLKRRLLSKIGYQSILVPEEKIMNVEVFRNYLNNILNEKS